MKNFLMTVFFVGLGFWTGANRLLPLWVIGALGVLGGVCWIGAEWMERKEESDSDPR